MAAGPAQRIAASRDPAGAASRNRTVALAAMNTAPMREMLVANHGHPRGRDMVMAPVWLTVVAWLYLSVCFCCASIIAYDIAVNRRRQPMGVMNFVFPITALYFGPFALALYWR
jgi:hypothetical protein